MINGVSSNCNSEIRKQPPFERLTQACIEAGIRGSDYHCISDVIERTFGFQPSDRQVTHLERQIIDRRRELDSPQNKQRLSNGTAPPSST